VDLGRLLIGGDLSRQDVWTAIDEGKARAERPSEFPDSCKKVGMKRAAFDFTVLRAERFLRGRNGRS
jgi:hypothetical protein